MNDAHLHLVVNHFPIIGTILGLGVVVIGIVFKNKSVINTAYGLFIIAALFAVASMTTGEGAEELVEDMPNIGKKIIHEHEEAAEKLAFILYALGTVSLVGIYLNLTNNAKSRIVTYLVIILAAVGVFFAQKTGTTGGEIRHTEIRTSDSNENSTRIESKQDED
jgi:uncharacterized membrane protein